VRTLVGVNRNNALDRTTADGAKRFLPRKHDAVHFGPIVTLGFVICSLECADFPGIFLRSQHGIFLGAFLPEEGVHFCLGLARGAQLFALLLNVPLEPIKLLFIPRSRDRRSQCD